MNTLLLFLFLGASVALAELPLDHETLVEFLNKEDEELVGEEMADEENEEGEELFGEEMADEENDPRRPRPSPPPYVRVCQIKLRRCINDTDEGDACGKLECLKKFNECIKSHRPSRRPTFRPSPRMIFCRAFGKKCMADAGNDCGKKIRCVMCTRRCMRSRRCRFCKRPRPTRP